MWDSCTNESCLKISVCFDTFDVSEEQLFDTFRFSAVVTPLGLKTLHSTFCQLNIFPNIAIIGAKNSVIFQSAEIVTAFFKQFWLHHCFKGQLWEKFDHSKRLLWSYELRRLVVMALQAKTVKHRFDKELDCVNFKKSWKRNLGAWVGEGRAFITHELNIHWSFLKLLNFRSKRCGKASVKIISYNDCCVDAETGILNLLRYMVITMCNTGLFQKILNRGI